MISKKALPNLDSPFFFFTNYTDINSLKTQQSQFTDRYHGVMKTLELETHPLLTDVKGAVGTDPRRMLRWLLCPVTNAGSSTSTLSSHTFAVFSRPGLSKDCQLPLSVMSSSM